MKPVNSDKVLTFREGHFRLIDAYDEKPVELRAAAALRGMADKSAQKVLNRLLVKYYSYEGWLPDFLDPHQVKGVRWILTRSRSYLAHAPGAGKTIESLTASLMCDGEGQCLIICPPTLTANWAREVGKVYDLLDIEDWPAISVIPDSARQTKVGWKSEILICADSMLTKPWVLPRLVATKKRIVIVDEASRFKEAKAARTRALFGGKIKKGLSSPGLIQEARHAVLLDGSPMPNRSMELWAPTFAMAPEAIDFMSQEEFGYRYCGATQNDYGDWEFKHNSHQGELKAKLQKSFMHVVTEDQLGHSERRRKLIYMTKDVRSAQHKEWDRKNLSDLKIRSEEDSRGDLARFRRELGLRKVDWAVQYIKERRESGEAILVFAWHRDVCIQLSERLNAPLIMSGIKPAMRETYFKRFQSGKDDMLVGNILTMGRGHNLQRADRIIFPEYSWTNETNLQAEKRASRRGRDVEQPVACDYLVSPGSFDEVILSSVFIKEKNVKRVIG